MGCTIRSDKHFQIEENIMQNLNHTDKRTYERHGANDWE